MGMLWRLDRIEPDCWKEACDRISADMPTHRDQAARILEAFGRDMDDCVFAAFEEAEDEFSVACARGHLLEVAVAEESWHLDSSLSRGLGDATQLLHELKPIGKKIVGFRGIDVGSPDCCFCGDGGVWGVCSTGSIQDCLEVVSRYDNLETIRALAMQKPPGLFGFTVKARRRREEAVAVFEDDYNWAHWQDVCLAVKTVCSKQHYLGIGMG